MHEFYITLWDFNNKKIHSTLLFHTRAQRDLTANWTFWILAAEVFIFCVLSVVFFSMAYSQAELRVCLSVAEPEQLIEKHII